MYGKLGLALALGMLMGCSAPAPKAPPAKPDSAEVKPVKHDSSHAKPDSAKVKKHPHKG